MPYFFTWRKERCTELAEKYGSRFIDGTYILHKYDGMRMFISNVKNKEEQCVVVASPFQISLFQMSRGERTHPLRFPHRRKYGLANASLVFYDYETSSLDIPSLQILQVAAKRLEPNGEMEHMMLYFKHPEFEISPEASKVNGLTEDDWRLKYAMMAPHAHEVFRQFILPKGNRPVFLIAQNGYRFDHLILLRDFPDLPTMISFADTIPIAKRVLPKLPNRKMGTIVDHLAIAPEEIMKGVERCWDWDSIFEPYRGLAPEGVTPESFAEMCAKAHDSTFDTEALFRAFMRMKQVAGRAFGIYEF